jgi:nicotinamidase-related amidase
MNAGRPGETVLTKDRYITVRNLDGRVRRWKKAIAPFERHPFSLKPASTALLVTDMQLYFTREGGHAHLPASEAIYPRLKKLVETFKEKGSPVIFTRHAHRKGEEGILGVWWRDTIREGTEESELDGRLYAEKAPILHKTRYSAFFGTELERFLRRKGIRTVVISGVMSHLCCDTTARDAFMRDFQVVFLMDATASSHEELHVSTLRAMADGFAEVLTCNELAKRLGWRK